MSITQQLAKNLLSYEYSELPKSVIKFAEICLMDSIGCMVRGSSEELVQILGRELVGETVTPDILLQGVPSVSRHDAALLIGSSIHAIDFDDTHPTAIAHLGAPVIAALHALGVNESFSHELLISAIVAGYETGCRITPLLDREAHYVEGFHCTGTVGVFAATAACARVLKLDLDQTSQALSMAATQASGIKSIFGTMAKPFNAGKAASNGVISARLIKQGFKTTTNAIEAEKGFLKLFHGKEEANWQLKSAKQFEILNNQFKLHAACHATHPMINALREQLDSEEIHPDQIDKVEVRAATISLRTASFTRPSTSLEAKFSFPFVAAAVIRGLSTVADSTFDEAMCRDHRMIEMMDKILMIDHGNMSPALTQIKIYLNNGTIVEGAHDLAESMRDIDRLVEPLCQKFIANSSSHLSHAKAQLLLSKLTPAFNQSRIS